MKAVILVMKSGHTYIVSDYVRGPKGSDSISGEYREILPNAEVGPKKSGPFPYAGIESMITLKKKR